MRNEKGQFQKGDNERLGKSCPEEVRKKIGKANRGKKRTEAFKENLRRLKGKGVLGQRTKELWENLEYRTHMVCVHRGQKYTEELRKKRSAAYKGKKSHFWKGGVTPVNQIIRTSIEFRLWREAVFARDNWTCQKTSERGGKLHPHHVQNFADYPELRFEIDNGVTLSGVAHRKFHKEYGIKNNTREQLEEFLAGVNDGG